MARSFIVPDLMDNKGRFVVNATCKAFRIDTHVLVETQHTDSNGSATFTALPDSVDCTIVAFWAGGMKTQWFFSEAPADLSELSGDIDDISDGSTYAKLSISDLTSNRVDIDKMLDGSSYAKLSISDLTTNRVDIDKMLDGTTYKRLLATERTKLTAIEALADVTRDHVNEIIFFNNLIVSHENNTVFHEV